MGTRVRRKNQSGIEHDTYTVGHGCFSPFNRDHNRVGIIDIVSGPTILPDALAFICQDKRFDLPIEAETRVSIIF
jgi:hypothetical protein